MPVDVASNDKLPSRKNKEPDKHLLLSVPASATGAALSTTYTLTLSVFEVLTPSEILNSNNNVSVDSGAVK